MVEKSAATLDVVTDTFNGLLAFIVPGPDEYSVAQGVHSADPGAIEADVTRVMIETIDDTAPYLPGFSGIVALSSAVPPDEHGLVPRVQIRHRQRSERTIRNREFLVERAVELLRRLGAEKIYRVNKPPFVIHAHSTMRMGRREENSVLDENAEARAVRRLFIADNSALANGLGGPNRTLTTQALATRTAEKIFQLYFDGAPWVSSESPVSSIDPRVTRAVQARGL